MFKRKTKKEAAPAVMVQIGGTPAGSLEQHHKAVLDVLNTSAGDSVKQHALTVLGELGSVKNTTINGCSFSNVGAVDD